MSVFWEFLQFIAMTLFSTIQCGNPKDIDRTISRDSTEKYLHYEYNMLQRYFHACLLMSPYSKHSV